MQAVRFPDGVEIRTGVELRAVGRRLTGYCAVFDVEARIGDFSEIIRAGAFAGSLATRTDILALANHDAAQVLARTASGTLKLAEDSRGLSFDIAVPDTQLGRDTLVMVERGDMGGASIGFRVQQEHWPAGGRRELRVLDLVEISLVSSFAAYSQTTVAARSRPQAVALSDTLRYRIAAL